MTHKRKPTPLDDPGNIFHMLFYGDPGGGKSELAANACYSPDMILMFDGLGKARPYLEGYILKKQELKLGASKISLTIINCFEPDDIERKTVRRTLFLLTDTNVNKPTAYQLFNLIFPQIDMYMQGISAKLLTIDSGTTFQLAYKHWCIQELGGKINSEWDWLNPLTSKLEDICVSLIGKSYSTIITAHTNNSKTYQHGYQTFIASMPGRMADRILALHDNTYRIYCERDGTHKAQCSADDVFVANNNVNAPKTCANTMEEIMQNYKPLIWD